MLRGGYKDSRRTHLEGTEDTRIADTAAVFNLSETSPEQIQVSQETRRKGSREHIVLVHIIGTSLREWGEEEMSVCSKSRMLTGVRQTAESKSVFADIHSSLLPR